MSDLVGNPEDRFSRVAAQMVAVLTDLASGRTISEYKYSNKTNWFAESV